MRIYLQLAISISICMCLIMASTLTQAGPSEAKTQLARKHFKDGIALLEEDEYEEASTEFEKSVKMYPTKNGLFNLANCYLALHRYVEAIEVIARLKNNFSEELDDAWQEEILTFEQKMDRVISKVELEVNVDGALVVLNDEEIGTTPLSEPLFLEAGDHELKLTKEQYEESVEKFSLKDGEDQVVRITMAVIAEESDLEPEPEEPEVTIVPGKKKTHRLWTWVAWGIGGATGIAAIITGSKSLSMTNQLNDLCPATGECNIAYEDDRDTAANLGTATNVLIGVTAVAAVAGTILFFVEGKQIKESQRVSVVPAFSPQGAGLFLSKTF